MIILIESKDYIEMPTHPPKDIGSLTPKERISILKVAVQSCQEILHDKNSIKKVICELNIIKDNTDQLHFDSSPEIDIVLSAIDESVAPKFDEKSNEYIQDPADTSEYKFIEAVYGRYRSDLQQLGFPVDKLRNSDFVVYASIFEIVVKNIVAKNIIDSSELSEEEEIRENIKLNENFRKEVESVVGQILLEDFNEFNSLLKEYDAITKGLLNPELILHVNDENFIKSITAKLETLKLEPPLSFDKVAQSKFREKLNLFQSEIQEKLAVKAFATPPNLSFSNDRMLANGVGGILFKHFFPEVVSLKEKAIAKFESVSVLSQKNNMPIISIDNDDFFKHIRDNFDERDITRLFNEYILSYYSNYMVRTFYLNIACMDKTTEDDFTKSISNDFKTIANLVDDTDLVELSQAGNHPAQKFINLACNIFMEDFSKLVFDNNLAKHELINTIDKEVVKTEMLQAWLALLPQIITTTLENSDNNRFFMYSITLPIFYYAKNITFDNFQNERKEAWKTLNQIKEKLPQVITDLQYLAFQLADNRLESSYSRGIFSFNIRNYSNKKIVAINQAIVELQLCQDTLNSKLKDENTNTFLLCLQTHNTLSTIIEEKLLNKNELSDIHGLLESMLINILKFCYKLVGLTYISPTESAKQVMDEEIKSITTPLNKALLDKNPETSDLSRDTQSDEKNYDFSVEPSWIFRNTNSDETSYDFDSDPDFNFDSDSDEENIKDSDYDYSNEPIWLLPSSEISDEESDYNSEQDDELSTKSETSDSETDDDEGYDSEPPSPKP